MWQSWDQQAASCPLGSGSFCPEVPEFQPKTQGLRVLSEVRPEG